MGAALSVRPVPVLAAVKAVADDFGPSAGSAITVGLDIRLAGDIRHELGEYPLRMVAEFPTPEAAIEAFGRARGGPRIIITQFRSQADQTGLRRLNGLLAGWPVIALVDIQADPENLFWANRAGAAQVVPLPLDPKDLRAALDTVAVQFNLNTHLAQTIVFTPASGGCGATTLAAVAAQEIATQLGRKTLLIELAPQLGSLATNLGLTPKATLPDMIERGDGLDLFLLQNALTPAGNNLSVLPGPVGLMPAGWLRRSRAERLVQLARKMAEVVVLDVPPTFDALQFDLVNAADHAVLIGQQSVAAVRSLRLLLDNLGPSRNGDTRLVLNMFDPASRGFSVEDIRRAMGVPELVAVPRDTTAMLAAVNRGLPLREVAPHSPALKCVSRLVEQLVGEPSVGKPGGAGLFSRLFQAIRS